MICCRKTFVTFIFPGIQQYLYENGRIDNIFCDTYYEKFTDCLDEVCKKFSVLYNDSRKDLRTNNTYSPIIGTLFYRLYCNASRRGTFMGK